MSLKETGEAKIRDQPETTIKAEVVTGSKVQHRLGIRSKITGRIAMRGGRPTTTAVRDTGPTIALTTGTTTRGSTRAPGTRILGVATDPNS